MKTPAAAGKSPILPKAPCNWLLTCHGRTCIFSGPAWALPFPPPAAWWGPTCTAQGRPAAACWQPSRCSWGSPPRCPPSSFFFALCYPMRGCSSATLTWVTCPNAYCLMHICIQCLLRSNASMSCVSHNLHKARRRAPSKLDWASASPLPMRSPALVTMARLKPSTY